MTQIPRYPGKADYTTNSPSYYDDLARKNELMKYLSQRIWEYDKELAKKFELWDKMLDDGLAAEINKVMLEWLADGTFDKIINENLFGELNNELMNLKNRLAKIDGIGAERVYLYVNAASGNDQTADGTQSYPYQTIQACLDDIPKVINQDRFIMIAPGTYNEDARIKSVSGSAVYLQSTQPGQFYKVNSLEFFDINGLTRVESADFTGSTNAFNLRFSRCNYGTSNNNRFTAPKLGTDKVAIEFDGTQGSVNSCHFDGQYTCVFAQNGSHVRVDSTNTHGTTASLRAVSIFSAHVYFNEQVEWIDQCTNPITVSRGGRYTWDRLPIDLNLLNGWSSIDNGTYQARAFIDDANMVHLMGAITGGTVGDVNAFILPEEYRPVFNTYVFPVFTDDIDNPIGKLVIDRTGQAQIQRGSNTPYVSLSGISFYSGR